MFFVRLEAEKIVKISVLLTVKQCSNPDETIESGMSEEFKKVKVVADLTVGTKAEKVVIKSLSMTGCHARLTFKLRPRESVVLRFYENQEENGFSSF
ncbi:MAG TPA: hypothetical protein ENK06_10400, partial [Gammaproteobacteria bacterium]|nr:hypothetical protein [Gammaproteobacteria bacterium]